MQRVRSFRFVFLLFSLAVALPSAEALRTLYQKLMREVFPGKGETLTWI